MHEALHLLAPGLVGLLALLAGVVAHELLHVLPLALADADYRVTILPDRRPGRRTPAAESPAFAGVAGAGSSALRHALAGSLVRVEVTDLPDVTPEWVVRTAALLPVTLALPLVLVAAGVLPDPVAAGDAMGTAALVAVTACGLPSPADWAVARHGSELSVADRDVGDGV